jgi:hypothetical protein
MRVVDVFVVNLTTIFSNLDYITPNERVIGGWCIGKGRGSGHGQI